MLFSVSRSAILGFGVVTLILILVSSKLNHRRRRSQLHGSASFTGQQRSAAAVALAKQHRGTTLFWLSFDGRWLRRDPGTTAQPDVVALA